jgi:hypothetical protein
MRILTHSIVDRRRFLVQLRVARSFFPLVELEVDQSIFSSLDGLKDYFSALSAQWIAYAEALDFQHCYAEAVLFTLMGLFTYEGMIASNKAFLAMDRLFLDLADRIPLGDSHIKVADLIARRGQKFDKAIELFRRAFAAESPLLTMNFLRRSNAAIKEVLVEQFGEAGMDEMAPCILLVATKAKAPNFLSKTEYLLRCFYSFSDSFTSHEFRSGVLGDILALFYTYKPSLDLAEKCPQFDGSCFLYRTVQPTPFVAR